LRRACLIAPFLLMLAIAGCGGGGTQTAATSATGLQAPAAAGTLNTYIGTSPFDDTASGVSVNESYQGYGLWNVSLDHANLLFKAYDVTTQGNNTDFYSPVAAGVFQSTGGFLSLSQTNDPSPPRPTPVPPAGFALEIPGRVAVLRQGDSTIPVTALVPNGCPSITGSTQFNFVTLPTAIWASSTDAAYGSLSISTSASGANWNLASYQLSTLAGTAAPANGTALPAGTCAPTAAGMAVYLPTSGLTVTQPTGSTTLPLPKTVAVGPSGFYIADQGSDADGNGYPGQFGVIQPSAALNTSDVLSKQYLGFTFEPGADGAGGLLPESMMAGFGSSTPAGQLVGGVFANDDPTQPVQTYLTIDLGTQDTTVNGLYQNVVITNQITGTIYPAVAVVGNPESKYSILIIGEDMDFSLPLGIYLFQQ
jgi:hypothetical protein